MGYCGQDTVAQEWGVRPTYEDLPGILADLFVKTEIASYRKIAEALAFPSQAILFLPDTETELDAATETGVQTTHIVWPGTRQSTRHPVSLDSSANSRAVRPSRLA